MQTEVVFAGFGGQGVLTAGKFLALAGMEEGKEVCWMPAYGPEMRGGTANCTVILSDRMIGSPIIANPKVAIAMNLPSLDKFEPALVPGGLVIINSSLIERDTNRDDLDVLKVPCNQMAIDLGNPKIANVIILGAFLGKMPIVKIETIKKIIDKTFAKKGQAIVELNYKALEAGIALGQNGGGKA
jgi:2-oxoglutarate ferredoxin oxidoreductase subunit gamma